jgi:hypothetical protein
MEIENKSHNFTLPKKTKVNNLSGNAENAEKRNCRI